MSPTPAQGFMDEIGLPSPWMNVAGFLGYLPPARMDFEAEMGAFVPPVLTLQQQLPAENRALIQYTGGFLLHNALPNPGMGTIIKQYAKKWARVKVPVWLQVFAENEDEAAQMSALADELENVLALQVEFPLRTSTRTRLAILNAAKGEKPLLAVLPAAEVDREFLTGCASQGVSGAVLAAPRGRLMARDGWVNGRLYGPSLLPQIVFALERHRRFGFPLIAGSGIFSVAAGEQLLKAGAAALQVDAALWI